MALPNVWLLEQIYFIFDDNYEVRGVFLDISKAFDKVWHEGIIHKQKDLRKLINLFNRLLRNRK